MSSSRRARVLVDCGLFQGGRRAEELNRPPLEAGSAPLDAVLLTHGEDGPRTALAGLITERHGLKPELAGVG